ncbi:MSF1-domain-containing protein [Piromyces finnis]|uniref:MSF1-domain-containing protein n=1 Tax=Piromyces finnis TaxID=1754191 RepID=A0A1Y1VKM3_9FUNG|nr:MSF1-domain-containing protein [Piromyces finnis]|eukprot:ORX57340.1 MSF1-domain-containing protein [Piromyces finnis]
MVKFFKQVTDLKHSWEQLTLAVWSKYPNPHSSHVLTSDVVDRYVDSRTGYLYTTRVFLKTHNLPKWGRKLVSNNEAFVVEHSVCKPNEGTMVVSQKNLSHAKLLLVEETQKFIRKNELETTMVTKARITSNIWGPLCSKIESVGLKRMIEGTKNSCNGLLYAVDKLKTSKNAFAFKNSLKALK